MGSASELPNPRSRRLVRPLFSPITSLHHHCIYFSALIHLVLPPALLKDHLWHTFTPSHFSDCLPCSSPPPQFFLELAHQLEFYGSLFALPLPTSSTRAPGGMSPIRHSCHRVAGFFPLLCLFERARYSFRRATCIGLRIRLLDRYLSTWIGWKTAGELGVALFVYSCSTTLCAHLLTLSLA